MAIEKVVPVKQEVGTPDDVEYLNAPANPNEDAPNVRGVYIQADTGNDTAVVVSRDNLGNLTLTDANAGTKLLSDFTTDAAHTTLRQLIHLAEEGGPFEGFSGAYREVLPLANPFPTSIIWWTSPAKTAKIVENQITYNVNKTISTEVWIAYDIDGVTPVATATDTITYSGTIFEATRTRTIV